MSTENKFLRKEIINFLKQHTEVDSTKLHVDTDHGLVILTGKADGPVTKATLEALTRTVPGVTEVINRIEIDSDNMSGVEGIRIH